MKHRDLSILTLGDKKLILATDSSAALGMKELDLVRVDNYTLGRFLAQVPFMEIIAAGASPSYVILPICNEMEPTAKGIIDGVKSLMAELGMEETSINGSTEENMVTRQTAATITVLAVVDASFEFAKASRRDYIFSLGLPKVGLEVVEDRGEIMDLTKLRELRALGAVGDILPVGSKGILYEAEELARSQGLKLRIIGEGDFLYKSAGPATVALCTAPPDYMEELKKLALPVNLIAELV